MSHRDPSGHGCLWHQLMSVIKVQIKKMSEVLQSVSFYILYYVGLHCRQNKDKRNDNIIYLNYVEGDRIIIYRI